VVPGPQFGPDHPYLAVAESNTSLPRGLSASTVLQTEAVVVRRAFTSADTRLVVLKDGSPGLLWSNPDRLEADPRVPLTDYSLFALRGDYLFRVFFETTTAAFAAERDQVRAVMLDFRATGD
jgi:hypothetical protein